TATVRGPRARSAALTRSPTERASRTAAAWLKTRAERPSRSIACLSAGSRRSPSARRAPVRWKAWAMPKPIPAAAPVTSTTWSLKSNVATSVKREHRLSGVAPGHQILRDLRDLLTRTFEADVRRELARGYQVGQTPQPDRGGLVPEPGECFERVERRAAGHEELPRVERDFGRGRDAERDADTGALQRRQRGAERPPAHRLDDQIVLGLFRDLVPYDHLVGAELAHRRHLIGPADEPGHVGAGLPREQDGEIPDASGRARDQQTLGDERPARTDGRQR